LTNTPPTVVSIVAVGLPVASMWERATLSRFSIRRAPPITSAAASAFASVTTDPSPSTRLELVERPPVIAAASPLNVLAVAVATAEG
jgi:hypothetical protein